MNHTNLLRNGLSDFYNDWKFETNLIKFKHSVKFINMNWSVLKISFASWGVVFGHHSIWAYGWVVLRFWSVGFGFYFLILSEAFKNRESFPAFLFALLRTWFFCNFFLIDLNIFVKNSLVSNLKLFIVNTERTIDCQLMTKFFILFEIEAYCVVEIGWYV